MSLNNQLDEIIAAAKRDMLFVDSNSGKILIRYRMQDGRLNAENIWTVVEGDDDLWLIPGKHLVNRMACYFSHTPRGDADIELEFWYVS